MRRSLALLLATTISVPCASWGRAPAASRPDAVVDSAYAAFNRHDPSAFLSFFADSWWSAALEDTTTPPRRHVRADELKTYLTLDAFHNRPTIRLVRRLLAGSYVIDLQSRGRDSVIRLDVFEVRSGKIVRLACCGMRRFPEGHLQPIALR